MRELRKKKLVGTVREGISYCENRYKKLFRKADCAQCRNHRTMHALDPRKRPICLPCSNKHYGVRSACGRPLSPTASSCRGAR